MLLFAANEKSSPVATDLSGGFIIISMLWLSTQLSLLFEGSTEFVWEDESILICCHLPRGSSGIF